MGPDLCLVKDERTKDCPASLLRDFQIGVLNLLLVSTNEVSFARHHPKGFRNKKKKL